MAKSRINRRAISVSAYFGLTWWGVALLAIAGATTSGVLTPWISLVATLLSVWALVPLSERWFRLRIKIAIPVAFAILAAAQGIKLFAADHDVLLMIADILAGILPVSLMRRKTGLTYWFAFLTAFLLSLAGVVSEGELNTYSLFILFLAVAAANLNAAHLYVITGPSQARVQTLSFRYFRQFTSSALAGFAFGAFIFLAFPREYSWANPWGMREKTSTLGYTNSITLDGSSINGDSSALAFTLESTEPLWLATFAKDLYFRGNTVDNFDGIHWTASASKQKSYRGDQDLRLTPSHAMGITRLKIYREASSTTNLFYPQVLRAITFPPRFGAVSSDQNGNLYRNRSEAFPFVYEVSISNPLLPTKNVRAITQMVTEIQKEVKEEKSAGDVPYRLTSQQLKKLLEVPAKIADADYFKHWAAEIKFDPEKDTAFSLTNSIRRNFQKTFKATYIHDMPANTAFETFLSKEKKGHCEYFSTAAVLFLRTQGIPARVVLGYFGGFFNPISRVTEVRESNAHAWVEYYYPGQGWFTFDPTPLSPNPHGAAWLVTASYYYSAARFWFNRYVADYNSRTQVALIRSLVIHNPDRKTAANGGKNWLILISVFATLGILIAFLFSRRIRRQGPDVPEYYRTFLRKVAKAGFARNDSESYRAFHRRLVAAGLNSALVDEVAGVVEIDLYSRLRTQATLRKKIKSAVRQIKVR